MQIRHSRRFRQNGPFLAGDKSTVYQKHGLWYPDQKGTIQGECHPFEVGKSDVLRAVAPEHVSNRALFKG